MEYDVQERSLDDAELTGLLEAAFAELVVRNGREGRTQVKSGARYFVVLDGEDRAVGCGAVQVFGPDTEHAGDGEVKRMYVAPPARGRGYARALLTALENAAREANHPVLRLTTSERQPEAIALYESCGFVRVDPWGKYVAEPTTRCYGKPLNPTS